MRQAIIAGNWKMFKSSREAKQFAEEFKPLMEKVNHCEIVICPPFTCLETLARELAGSNIALGAQNMHWEEQGAFTGEISPLMLRELGCKYAIIGHSERREYFGETDEIINRKLKTAQKVGLIPILCVGEKLEHRETGVTNKVIEAQLNGALQSMDSADIGRLVIAYEPVWAIGTGKTASSKDAEEVCEFIRNHVSSIAGSEIAQAIRIQYGGSVKPASANELMSMPNIDGALVGGASLEPESFAQIVKYPG